MKEKSPCRGSNPDLFGPNGYFQISWTPTKTGAAWYFIAIKIKTIKNTDQKIEVWKLLQFDINLKKTLNFNKIYSKLEVTG
jgi:hypothetical protein